MSARVRWARLRFSIIGPLLSAPAEVGDLAARIGELAARPWRHPTIGDTIRFSAKTIERWYYTARNEQDPIQALERKVPKHAGTHPSVTAEVAEAIRTLRKQHPRWSYKLVADNLAAIGRERPDLGVLPGYATVARFMKHHGLGKHRRPRRHEREAGFVPRERRLFEVTHVHGLWHCDFHESSRKVLTASGERMPATMFAVLDDHSRLCCHAQWHLGPENTESFVHGLCQALAKRGLPRALLSDNGSPMLAAETREGLERLSVEHHTTLSQTPEQNGKQEVFFASVEGRLMAMLDGEAEITLELLNHDAEHPRPDGQDRIVARHGCVVLSDLDERSSQVNRRVGTTRGGSTGETNARDHDDNQCRNNDEHGSPDLLHGYVPASTFIGLPNVLAFSGERQGRLRAYHGREERPGSARGVAASANLLRKRVSFGCCNGRLDGRVRVYWHVCTSDDAGAREQRASESADNVLWVCQKAEWVHPDPSNH
ncbi:MAG: DDE-type integrase/transposase/recombinase [Polyangia bacterium]